MVARPALQPELQLLMDARKPMRTAGVPAIVGDVVIYQCQLSRWAELMRRVLADPQASLPLEPAEAAPLD